MSIVKTDGLRSETREIKVHKNLKLNKNSKIYSPGMCIQRKFKFCRKDVTDNTGGAYNEYYAYFTQLKIKITAKQDNSAFYVKVGINGEPANTHDWVLKGARRVGDGDATVNATNWEMYRFGHYYDTESPTTLYHYLNGYTNPGPYNDGDYNSTPIQTATMEFMDTPEVDAGTDIYYMPVFMSTGNHTWYLNRCINASVGGAYERGVSYIHVQELCGPATITNPETGIEVYTF